MAATRQVVPVAPASGFLHGSPMHLGTGELIIIGFVIVVVFSASRMGSLGNALGKFVYSFKKATRGADLVDVTPRPAPRSPPEDAQLVAPSDKPNPRGP
jgi:sec-independent protein translocase protein TatA